MLGLITAGLGVASFAADLINRRNQAKAAEEQSEAMAAQYQRMNEMLSPYTSAGQAAMEQQQALSGALGSAAQAQAIAEIESSPQLQAAIEQGEAGMLANAAATGGLRGGNLQGALAQYRPQMLSQAIDQRYQQLGGLANMGYNAASQLGSAGMNVAAMTPASQPGFGADLGASLLTGLSSGVGAYTGLGGTFGQTGGKKVAPVASKATPVGGSNAPYVDFGKYSNPGFDPYPYFPKG